MTCQSPRKSWRDIAKEVATHRSVPLDALLAESWRPESKVRNVAWARFELIARLRDETRLSTTAIGHRIGNRDHSSICHATTRYRELTQSGQFERGFVRTISGYHFTCAWCGEKAVRRDKTRPGQIERCCTISCASRLRQSRRRNMRLAAE